jgi:glycerol-3-phosphate cytidylyltransferase
VALSDSRVQRALKGYVPGAYDVFHVGHLTILRRARTYCDELVVGVVTDEVLERTKGRKPVVPLDERMEIVSSLGIVDTVVADDCGPDKTSMWQRLHFDILFKGDDWQHTAKGDQLEATMSGLGVRICYFPYTRQTSSTLLRAALSAGSLP